MPRPIASARQPTARQPRPIHIAQERVAGGVPPRSLTCLRWSTSTNASSASRIQGTIVASRPDASISGGCAALRPEETREQLTRRADAALYAAKQDRQPPAA